MTVRDVSLPAGRHYGDVGFVSKVGALIVAESSYPPLCQTPLHLHETASFTFTTHGSYLEEFTRGKAECSPDHVLFRPAGEIHRDLVGAAGAHCLMIELPSDWLRGLEGSGLRLSRPAQTTAQPALVARLRRELTLADDLTALGIEALALEVACHVQRSARERRHPPRWLQRVREAIAHDRAGVRRLQSLARQAGVHPAHLARAFRQHYGSSIGEHVRQQRIAFCCEELRRGKIALSDLAAGAGFSSQAHFTRSFKACMHMTPGEFRRLVSGPASHVQRRNSLERP